MMLNSMPKNQLRNLNQCLHQFFLFFFFKTEMSDVYCQYMFDRTDTNAFVWVQLTQLVR